VMVAEDGPVYAIWLPGQQGPDGGNRFQRWFAEWKADVGIAANEPFAAP
jgi:hypothetical protein